MADDTYLNQLPAVLIGGPPHSGKSVLIYSLSQALRARGIEHYALRACPDGEGDWSNEAPQDLVREIRIKGAWTREWVERITIDIDRRHLPLLVDIGGRPTPEQAAMFGHCTHAVILTPDRSAQAYWRNLIHEQSLPILADLASVLHGENLLVALEPIIEGVLSGLKRGAAAAGPAFDALVERLVLLFSAADSGLHTRHLVTTSPEIELVIDLNRLARTLGWVGQDEKVHWLPDHLSDLLEYLPAATPLAVYGRGTIWIHAALARLAYPAAYCSFDIRLGWVRAVPLRIGRPVLSDTLRFTVSDLADAAVVSGDLPTRYIDYSDIEAIVAPAVAPDKGVILHGKLPYWLYTSLAIAYDRAPWLAVYQPSLAGAVVVSSSRGQPAVGTTLVLPPIG